MLVEIRGYPHYLIFGFCNERSRFFVAMDVANASERDLANVPVS